MLTDYKGHFKLLTIKKIVKREHKALCCTLYFLLTNDNKKIICTPKHCFLTIDGMPKIVTELKSDDSIWIDYTMFKKDGSILDV